MEFTRPCSASPGCTTWPSPDNSHPIRDNLYLPKVPRNHFALSEGVIFKRLNDAYHPSARGWQKYKVRETSEATVGAITGSPAVPARCCSAGTTTKAAFSILSPADIPTF
ncbi:hypothetical protein [Streptomyces sp. NPDC016675]|uniref:hypothetical protein n=1 Tax=Streptomyces sp. NPDC016675 TaxID=3364970 RepID=UPI0036FE22A2